MLIKKNLEIVINSINDFSKQTNMVAINAAIYASRLSNSEGAPFQVLAKKIQDMSAQSIDKLGELDKLMNYVTNLSVLINKVGSQRMLLMKMIVANTMNNLDVLNDCIQLFESNQEEIKRSTLNTPETLAKGESISVKWSEIKETLIASDTETNFNQANTIVLMINDLLHLYEESDK